ncbi:MAG: serine hydrolase [Armatimonadota bacterium]
MHRKISSAWTGLYFTVCAVLVGIVPLMPAAAAEAVFPGAEWESKKPEEVGMDGAKLDQLAAKLGGNGFVVRDGYAVKAWGAPTTPVGWLSSSKPVLTTLLFFAIDEKKAPEVDARIKYVGWDLKPKDDPMTYRHLADMVSGYARPEPPGEAFAYNDYAIQLYFKTVEKLFGRPLTEVLRDRLEPLRFQDEITFPRFVHASPRDFARIGWFWLNKGTWGEREVLPIRYFNRYMKPDVPADLPETDHSAETDDYLGIGSYGGGSDHFTRHGPGIYGFNWWFNKTGGQHPTTRTWPDAPRDTIMSIGAGGNNCVIIPSLKLVLASGKGDWGKLEAGNPDSKFNQALKLLAEACADARPRQPRRGRRQ